jgi:hypothetical protein
LFENIFSIFEKLFKPLEKLFMPSEKLFKQPEKLFKPSEKLFKMPAKLFKKSEKLFKPPAKLFKPTEKLFKPLEKLFKPTEKLFKQYKNIIDRQNRQIKMGTKTDYIPRKDAELVPWSDNFRAHVAANAAEWGIPDGEVEELEAATGTFAALQAEADSPVRNPIIVAEKNAARRNLVRIIRTMTSFRLKNPVITRAGRIAMGLHVRDVAYSTIGVPTSHPALHVETSNARELKIAYANRGSRSKAKPYGISGAVIAYAVADEPPASQDDLTRSLLVTRTPYFLEFAEQERGHRVYFAVCWQNEKGRKGPWSDMTSTIVP